MKQSSMRKWVTVLSVSTVALAVFAAVVSVQGMSKSVGELRQEIARVESTTVVADSGDLDDGTQVAYDPNDPAHVAPLGESMTVDPNMIQPLATMITVQAAAVGVFSVLAMLAISVAWRYSRHDRN